LISSAEFLIIKSYIRSKKKDSFLKIISIFSFLGISIGVATLIIVMSVMNGFRAELFDKLLKFNPHITVRSVDGDLNIEKLNQFFSERKIEVKSIKRVIKSQGLLVSDVGNSGIGIVGISKEDLAKDDFFKNLKELPNFNKGSVLIGSALADKLGVTKNNKINVLSANNVSTPFGKVPQQFSFKVVSTFSSGISELDYNYVFISYSDALEFIKNNKNLISVDIKIKDVNNVDVYTRDLEKNFPNYYFSTWIDNNKTFFDALLVERNVMFIILTLIIIVAAFNIVTGMTILVKNKTKEIAIFNTLGMSKFSISKIFFIMGSFIGITGTIFGVVLGVLFAHNIESIRQFVSYVFQVKVFPPEIYFLSKMPSLIDYKSVLIICFFSVLITFLASLYPAISASRLNPIKGLKYD
jgi:lipoprotein-releasing system permease protein